MYVKDPVLIKSNRYGITIYFDHDMPYEELLAETGEKFRAFAHFFDHADMAVEFKGRAFTREEERLMAETIQDAAKIQILCIIEKDKLLYNIRIHGIKILTEPHCLGSCIASAESLPFQMFPDLFLCSSPDLQLLHPYRNC